MSKQLDGEEEREPTSEEIKALRDRLRKRKLSASGKCQECAAPSVPGKTKCQACFDKLRERFMSRKASGKCTDCAAPSVTGKTRCHACADKERKRSADARRKAKATP